MICLLLQLTAPYLLFGAGYEEGGFFCSLSIIILAGLFIGFNMLKLSALRINFFTITSFAILIGNGLGGVNSYLNISTLGISWNFFIKIYNVNNYNLINALTYTLLFSLTLYFISLSQFNNQKNYPQRIKMLILKNQKTILQIALAIVSIQALLILTGKVSIQGETGDPFNPGKVNPIISLINPLIPSVPISIAFLYRNTKKKSSKILLIILMIVEIIWFFLWGRRNIIYLFCLTTIGYFLVHPIKMSLVFKNFIPIFLFSLVLTTLIDYYQRIRIVGGVDILKTISVENIKTVYELSTSLEGRDFARLNAINLAFRTSTTLFSLATVDNLFKSGQMSHAFGNDFIGSFLKSTPSNFFVDKERVVVQEDLYNSLSNNKYSGGVDYGDSLTLAALVDFGIWGVLLVYPFVLWMTITLIKKISSLNHLVDFFTTAGLVYTGFSMIESTLISIFVVARIYVLIAILVIISLAFAKINPKK